MTTDMPSSDEMIRRAKATLQLETEDFLPMVDEDLAQRGVPMGGLGDSSSDGMLDELAVRTVAPPSSRTRSTGGTVSPMRQRRVASSSQDHLVVVPRNASTSAAPIPPSPVNTGSMTGSGRWMKIVGNLLLVFVAVIWVLLLIGLIDDPDDRGATIGGGVVMTLVPLIFGLVLRRAGTQRGMAA